MEWGFAHETGPFRTWDLLGVRETVERMESLGIEVGPWVKEMLEGGNESFYKTEDGRELQFSPVSKQYEPVREDPMYVSLDVLREEGAEMERNDSASLLDLGDGVLCLEFHSKGNSIDAGVTEMGYRALEALERDDVVGLVIGSEGRNFCVGANLGEVAQAVQNGKLDEVGESIEALQKLLMGFRFAPKPVVARRAGRRSAGGSRSASTPTA
jgi:3-hydroxyacyl-CoA dehydrogenase